MKNVVAMTGGPQDAAQLLRRLLHRAIAHDVEEADLDHGVETLARRLTPAQRLTFIPALLLVGGTTAETGQKRLQALFEGCSPKESQALLAPLAAALPAAQFIAWLRFALVCGTVNAGDGLAALQGKADATWSPDESLGLVAALPSSSYSDTIRCWPLALMVRSTSRSTRRTGRWMPSTLTGCSHSATRLPSRGCVHCTAPSL